MSKNKREKQYIVVGLGRFGRAIAETLCQDGAEVLGVDRRMDLVEDMRDVLTHVVQMDAMDRDALSALGVEDFDIAFVTMGSDIRASGTIVLQLKELGANKAALGHHMDDAVETFLLSLIYEGRISCFEPVTHMDRSGIVQIRPMLYAEEKRIVGLARKYAFPIVESTCPMDKTSKRALIKEYMYAVSRERKDFKIKTFRAMQRLPLPGWQVVKEGSRLGG